MPKVFIPKERLAGETRVAATPDTIRRMGKLGLAVTIEAGAGIGSSIEDHQYSDAGATVGSNIEQLYAEADIVLKFHPPDKHNDMPKHEVALLKQGATLISFLWPWKHGETIQQLAAKGVTSFAMDQIPRISRAQKMDALTSQTNLAGYKAVMLAAHYLPKLFPLMMTAAGTISPARVVVLGAGVAGLQAIATAKRLGAVVEVSDIRPAVKEQVESLGGRFIEVESDSSMEDAGGYAKEVSKEFLAKQQAVVAEHIAAADVVITTALVPGKPAPRLIPAETVRKMQHGSVIVDLAAEQGGNCELTKSGEVIQDSSVTIVGLENLASLVPYDASQVYARNVLAVVEHLFADGKANFDFSDEINAGAIVTFSGKVRKEVS